MQDGADDPSPGLEAAWDETWGDLSSWEARASWGDRDAVEPSNLAAGKLDLDAVRKERSLTLSGSDAAEVLPLAGSRVRGDRKISPGGRALEPEGCTRGGSFRPGGPAP